MPGLAGPLVFGPRSQRLTWPMVRALTSSDRGLRRKPGRGGKILLLVTNKALIGG
jgi:hypothetical protein